MIVYVLLFLVVFTLGLCECFEVRLSVGFKYFVLILLFFVSGLRYGIGEDYWNYVDIFNSSQDYLRLEPLFQFINLILKSCFLGGQASFLFFSFFTLLYIVLVIRKTNYFYIPICLYIVSYLYFESMNTVRQAIAMSLFFYAYTFFAASKKKIFYVYFFLAVMFHYSAIIMILFAYISKIRISKYMYIALLGITFFFGETLFNCIMRLGEVLIGSSIYSGYLQHMEMRGVQTGVLKIFLNLFVLFMLFFVCRLEKKDFRFTYYCNMLFFAIIVYNIFVNFYIVLRIYFYLYLFALLVFPAVLSLFTKRSKAIIYTILVLIYFIPLYKSLNRDSFVPYHYNIDIFREISFSEQYFLK